MMKKNSHWIWKSHEAKPNSYAWLVKSFELDETPDQAVFSVSAHNYFKLFVNGELISPPVSPASTVATKEKFYIDFDVKQSLTAGENHIEVVCLYLGGDGQNYETAYPGMWFHGIITSKDKRRTIKSDLTWDAYQRHPYKDGMPFRENRRVSAVEYFDSTIAKEHMKKAVWSKMNDLCPCLSKQTIPATKVHKTISPFLIHVGKNRLLYDLGEIITGFVEIRVQCIGKKKLTLRYGEAIKDNRLSHRVANEPSDNYKDIFVASKRVSRHSADFTYKAFRYVQVECDDIKPDDVNLAAKKTSTGIGLGGNLSVEHDPRIDRLFAYSVNTHLNNTIGLLADCPHREQAQYLGDSDLQAEFLLMNFKHGRALIEKVLQDFRLSQLEDGGFPFVAPGNYHHPDFHIRITEYDYFYLFLMEKLYRFTNDPTVIKPYMETAAKLCALIEKKYDDGMQLIRKDDHWHINDWPYPDVDMNGDYLTAENIWVYEALSIYERFCDELHMEHACIVSPGMVREGIRNNLMKDGLLVDHEKTDQTHQGVNALGVNQGIFDDDEINHVLNHIESSGFSSSIILGREVLEALLENGRFKSAYQYLFGYERGWESMLEKNGKTLWEGFDDMESHSHAWGSYPVALLQRYYLNFRRLPGQPKTYIISPLDNVPVGRVSSRFLIDEGAVEYTLRKDEKGIRLMMDYPGTIDIVCDNDPVPSAIKQNIPFYF